MAYSIAIFQEKIPAYRVPLFNALAKKYALIILVPSCFSLDKLNYASDIRFDVRQVPVKYFLGLHWINLSNLSSYGQLILPANCRCASLFNPLWILKLRSTVIWGPWFSRNLASNILQIYLVLLSRSTIFYSKLHLDSFKSFLPFKKYLYVALNTVDVAYSSPSDDYSGLNFLCVGSLVPRKQYNQILAAYFLYTLSTDSPRKLIFVGTGPCLDQLTKQADQFNITRYVEFVGHVDDPEHLSAIYSRSLLSLAYGQAGLSVLQSLGHGVPIACFSSAISGGEVSNIRHMQNGLLYTSLFELVDFMLLISRDRTLSKEFSSSARNYYLENATLDLYTDSFCRCLR